MATAGSGSKKGVAAGAKGASSGKPASAGPVAATPAKTGGASVAKASAPTAGAKKAMAKSRAALAKPVVEVVAPAIVLQPHQIVLRPLVTEKGMHRSTRENAYAFEVHALANKVDVRKAIEVLFEVKVEKVNIQNRKGKLRRTKMRTAYTKPWKKAIVFLAEDSRIDFY